MGLFSCFGGQPALVETIEQPNKNYDAVPKSMTRGSVRKSLRSVNLANNNINQIDQKFWLNGNLEDINLSQNKKLTKLPDDIAKLTKLKILNISYTGIFSFSAKFWTIKTLQELDLSHCKFKGDFPKEIENFVNLAKLNVSHNDIKKLPDSLSKCKKLTHFNFSYNKIGAIPETYGDLDVLESLECQSNELEYLPLCLDKMTKLVTLKVGVKQDEPKPELTEIKWNGQDVYTCKYLQDEAESVTMGETLPTVERAAPTNAVNKPIAPKRGSSKLTSSTTVTATVENGNENDSEIVEDPQVENSDSKDDGVVVDASSDSRVTSETDSKAEENTEEIAEEVRDVSDVTEEPQQETVATTKDTVDEQEQEVDDSSTKENVETIDSPTEEKPEEQTSAEQNSEKVTEEKVAETEEVKVDAETAETAENLGTTEKPETAEVKVEGLFQPKVEANIDESVEKKESDEEPSKLNEVQTSESANTAVTDCKPKNDQNLEPEKSENEKSETPAAEDQITTEETKEEAPEQVNEPEVTNGSYTTDETVILTETTSEQNVDTTSANIETAAVVESANAEENAEKSVEVEAKPEETNSEEIKPEDNDEKNVHYLEKEVQKDHEAIIKQRTKSVRDAARMFQNVAEESAKAKPSTPQTVRRMSNRKSIQTDQPTASMTGVVRVAVPIPENFVEKKPTPQVIPPQPKSIYDDKYADQRSSTYDNMPLKLGNQKESKVESEIVTETKTVKTETAKTNVSSNIAEASSKIAEVSKPANETHTTGKSVTVSSITQKDHTVTITSSVTESSEKVVVAQEVSETVKAISSQWNSIDQLPFETIISNLDFDSDPKEFTTKAVKKAKYSALGITISDGESVNPHAVFVSKFNRGPDVEWSGDELPRPGDVLVAIDGSEANSKTVDDLLSNCGNNITMTFHRFPGTFSGY